MVKNLKQCFSISAQFQWKCKLKTLLSKLCFDFLQLGFLSSIFFPTSVSLSTILHPPWTSYVVARESRPLCSILHGLGLAQDAASWQHQPIFQRQQQHFVYFWDENRVKTFFSILPPTDFDNCKHHRPRPQEARMAPSHQGLIVQQLCFCGINLGDVAHVPRSMLTLEYVHVPALLYACTPTRVRTTLIEVTK